MVVCKKYPLPIGVKQTQNYTTYTNMKAPTILTKGILLIALFAGIFVCKDASARDRWSEAWDVFTEHYNGRLTITETEGRDGDSSFEASLVLRDKRTGAERGNYVATYILPNALNRNELGLIMRGYRNGNRESRAAIRILLVRYNGEPVAFGYFQLKAGTGTPQATTLKQAMRANKVR